MIRIVIAEDHTIIREALGKFLQQQDDMEVVGQAKDGDGAMELASTLQPDIIIMDISMPPVLSGLEATRWICNSWPHVKVVALSMHSHRQYVDEMFKAGAKGYLLKDADFDELLTAIRIVADGGTYVSDGISGAATNA
ncbi:MAG: response regulator transcription factor [Phycisphaerales bacterium]|jgi:DNA-binding NarL/FixJ family response regulator